MVTKQRERESVCLGHLTDGETGQFLTDGTAEEMERHRGFSSGVKRTKVIHLTVKCLGGWT